MLVSELMRRGAHVCKASDPASVCARIMRREGVGFVPVVDDGGDVVGVVTDRDLAVRLLAADRPPETPVSEVMTVEPLLTVFPEESLRSLEEKLARGRKSRAMIIDHDGNLLGVVSLSDVAGAEESPEAAAELLRQVTSREVTGDAVL